MLLQMFRTIHIDYTELSDEKITQLVDAFMDNITSYVENETARCIKYDHLQLNRF